MLLYAVGYDAAHLEDVGDQTGGFGLQHDIAYGGALYGTRDNRDAQTIGCHLHQVFVVGATTNDMEFLDGERCQFTKVIYYLTVTEGQALEDAAGYLFVAIGHGLIGLPTIILNGFYHTGGIGKAWIVGVDDTTEGFCLHGICIYLIYI